MPPGQLIEGATPLLREVGLRQRLEQGLRITLFVVLCALLMFGPLALGVVQDWSIAVFEAGCGFIFLLWMLWYLVASEVRVRWSPLFAPMLAFAGLAIVQIAFHRSAYSYDSLSELWLLAAYGILMFVSTQLLHADSGFIPRFGKTMAAFGSVYAIFAILQGFTSEGKIYWLIKPRAGSIYGSYVNHNHYAGLIELLLPFALVLAFGSSLRAAPIRIGKRILLVFAATLMAASVFLCQSRGGMFAVVVEMIFLAVFWMRQFSPRKSAAVFVAFCLATALLVAWIAPQVGGRITNIHDPARWLIHRDAVRMFTAHPFLGSGLGTFATAFPRYRVFYDGFVINHAHDDYLEFLLDAGLIGFAVGVWFLVVLYREGIGNLHSGNHSSAKLSSSALIIGAVLAGCTGLLAHSFVDFNLHIPANAALFYVLCAIAVGGEFNKNKSSPNSYREKIGYSASYSR